METAQKRRDRITEALQLAINDHKAHAAPLVDWPFVDALRDAMADVAELAEIRRRDK